MKQNPSLSTVVTYLASTGPSHREDVIRGALSTLSVGMGKKAETARREIEAAVYALASRGDLTERDGYLCLSESAEIVVARNAAETEIRHLLAKPMTKARLYGQLEKRFLTDRTQSRRDDGRLRSDAGQILSRLLRSGEIMKEGDKYVLSERPQIKHSETFPAEDWKEGFREVLISRGGPAFERFTAGLLDSYYRMTGRQVLRCVPTGGSEDGGIDVEIETVDGLGFSDVILIQTKCRDRIHTTEKEIREFYGAMHACAGSRGIFVTTAEFHPAAQKFLDTLPNCVGVDGEKLLSLVEKTGYGIIRSGNTVKIDRKILN